MGGNSLEGRVVIVTGGGRGIGAGISRILGKAGAVVIIFHPDNGRFDEVGQAKSVAEEIIENGGRASRLCVDVSDRGRVLSAVDQVFAAHGRIDALVNNAGICDFASFFEITPENWERHLAVNLSGPFFLAQAVARHMKAQGKGSIVNISTVSSVRAGDQQVHYISSKGGLNSLTTSMAHELRDLNIRVNAILTGGVATDINLEKRQAEEKRSGIPYLEGPGVRKMGRPEDLGYAVRYLLSDESDWVTGVLMSVDGGAMRA